LPNAGAAALRVETDVWGVATLTLDRADKHNAFDASLLTTLGDVLVQLGRDPAVRAIVLTGAGSSFCAGADLSAMRAMATATEAENLRDAQHLADVLAQLAGSPRPTVARVNGNAFGGGVGLIACCDIAIANEEARFAFTEVRLGLVPAAISPYVVASIGAREARRYFLTGEAMSAAEARRIGLVHEMAPAAGLDAAVEKVIGSVIKGGPEALRECKELIREVAALNGAPDLSARRATAQRLARLRSSEEGREGIGAFLEKRAPRWIKPR
jgi:methylglutaconyl-CoA hydratase